MSFYIYWRYYDYRREVPGDGYYILQSVKQEILAEYESLSKEWASKAFNGLTSNEKTFEELGEIEDFIAGYIDQSKVLDARKLAFGKYINDMSASGIGNLTYQQLVRGNYVQTNAQQAFKELSNFADVLNEKIEQSIMFLEANSTNVDKELIRRYIFTEEGKKFDGSKSQSMRDRIDNMLPRIDGIFGYKINNNNDNVNIFTILRKLNEYARQVREQVSIGQASGNIDVRSQALRDIYDGVSGTMSNLTGRLGELCVAAGAEQSAQYAAEKSKATIQTFDIGEIYAGRATGKLHIDADVIVKEDPQWIKDYSISEDPIRFDRSKTDAWFTVDQNGASGGFAATIKERKVAGYKNGKPYFRVQFGNVSGQVIDDRLGQLGVKEYVYNTLPGKVVRQGKENYSGPSLKERRYQINEFFNVLGLVDAIRSAGQGTQNIVVLFLNGKMYGLDRLFKEYRKGNFWKEKSGFKGIGPIIQENKKNPDNTPQARSEKIFGLVQDYILSQKIEIGLNMI